ncbi:hypothetical protein Geob_3126 [Geotalea daltonii FRC-32]|uniref:DUF6602 domain-containing protein n=1 Tax=Geotalea daltonii (strain DSM 22248 / JCM 15807 / FRC-32) TaxID=316067 RepID=B9M3P8_GEODF|nr:DUF6602 domain-containing protein [Geotalea daltonii]ACM21469.1 hypothetical protein Geob_3126 [Geotalea daltonii FRC-32]
MDENFYLGLANEMAAKLRRVSSFVNHGPSIGSYHEEVLKPILESMLSERFRLRTGFAYTRKFGASQQGDILIVDENNPAAYHFREGNFAVVAPEAIVCAIEVKTKLNKKTFIEALRNLYSFTRGSIFVPPATFLFAYESVPLTQKVLSAWYDSVTDIPDELQNYPWAIYVLNRGIIILKSPSTNEEWGHIPIEGEDKEGPKLKSLSLFLQTIRKAMILHSKVQFNPFENAAFDGLLYSIYCYRYGPSSLQVANPAIVQKQDNSN